METVVKRTPLLSKNEIRARLARGEEPLILALDLTPEQAQELLAARAADLARVPPVPEDPGPTVEVLIFTLAGVRYAVESEYVQEIARMRDFTPAPGAPAFLLGLTNLRGEILAIVDLRKLFGSPSSSLLDLARIVVVGRSRREFGVLADAVEDVLVIRLKDLGPPPRSMEGIGADCCRGITPDAVTLLDGKKLLEHPKLLIDQSEEASV